jgi:hypothetical protein
MQINLWDVWPLAGQGIIFELDPARLPAFLTPVWKFSVLFLTPDFLRHSTQVQRLYELQVLDQDSADSDFLATRWQV